MLLIVLSLFSLLPIQNSQPDLEYQMLLKVNEIRDQGCQCGTVRRRSAQPVALHNKLTMSATLHARQMQRYGFFEHYSRGGLDIGQRTSAVGYRWATIGENLARGQRNVSEVVADWIDSPAHCEVLMNPKFREMGFARVGRYWVLHMGVRKSTQVAAR